jgi:hypothetical protein
MVRPKRIAEAAMTWGIPTEAFVQIHVGISLVAIVSGLIVLYGLLAGKRLAAWTALFLATTILTGVTGFPLPPFGWDPARVVGVILLVLTGAAVVALYLFHLAGAWRPIYLVAAVTSLYLNCFVGVVQAFQKVSALHALAPTQSEPPFLIAQVALLVAFVVLGVVAVVRPHPQTDPAEKQLPGRAG